MGYRRGDCVHWPAIEACLSVGPTPIGLLALDLYGEDSPINRHATSLVMMRMVRQGRVVRLRTAWFALPGKTDDWHAYTDEALVVFLRIYPRTAEEVAARFHVSEFHARRLIRRIGPSVRRVVAPRWRWPSGRYCYLYSLASPAVLSRALGDRRAGWKEGVA